MTNRRAVDIMTHPVVTVRPEMLLTDAVRLLLRHHISGMPVLSAEGAMVGIITEHDILNFAFSGQAADTRVEEAMSQPVISLPPDAELATVVNCLSNRHIRRVPIVDGEKVVGIVSRRDILREMLYLYERY